MANPTYAIQTNKLCKHYRGNKVAALQDLSIAIRAGEIYGFLGANGAGKSTAIRTLLNFLQPTSGSGKILGMDIVKQSVLIKHDVGYLAGDVALYDKLSGKLFLDYMEALHPLQTRTYRTQLVEDFKTEMDKPIGSLSKGNKQKLGIIQAMMHEPRVLILDEPTGGLDPLMQEVFFEHIQRAKLRGTGIFLSSHNLAEVQRICDRIGFIHEGKLVRELSMAELVQTAAHTFDLIFSHTVPIEELRHIPNSKVSMRVAPNSVCISVPSGSLTAFFSVLAQHPVLHFSQQEVNLEAAFMDFYREASNG